jgi:hypothetical protein
MSKFLDKLHESYSILNESNANENYNKIYKALHDNYGYRPGASTENKEFNFNLTGPQLLPIIRQMSGNENFVYPADIDDTWPRGKDLRTLASYATQKILPMAQQTNPPPGGDDDIDQNPPPGPPPGGDDDIDQNPPPGPPPGGDDDIDQNPPPGPPPDQPSRTRKTLNALGRAGKGLYNKAVGAPGYLQNLRRGLEKTADEVEKSNYTQGWDSLMQGARGKKPGYNLQPSTDSEDWEEWVSRKWNRMGNDLKTMYGSFENYDRIKRAEARDKQQYQ